MKDKSSHILIEGWQALYFLRKPLKIFYLFYKKDTIFDKFMLQ